ncbi:MAG: DNA repair protein RecN, partial [Bacilli bacterium]
KTVLNSLDPYDLLVFDEIDTGVSGRIASLVAKKIRSISDKSQVLVISHLPQVVASANSYLKIEKKVVDDNTITTALSLDAKDAYKEVAKMLAGEKVTETALKQALELIDEYHK